MDRKVRTRSEGQGHGPQGPHPERAGSRTERSVHAGAHGMSALWGLQSLQPAFIQRHLLQPQPTNASAGSVARKCSVQASEAAFMRMLGVPPSQNDLSLSFSPMKAMRPSGFFSCFFGAASAELSPSGTLAGRRRFCTGFCFGRGSGS